MAVTQPSSALFKKKVKLTLPGLHRSQLAFVDDQARIVVAAAGTKVGKTFGMSIYAIRAAWRRNQALVWWTAPTIRQSKIAFNLIGTFLPKHRFRVNRSDLCYELLKTNGDVRSRIEFRSADHPESLRGEGVHNAIVDEAAFWKYDSFVSVMTTLTKTRGDLRIISTPKGKNWFFTEWAKGWYPDQKKKNPEYSSHQLATSSNPTVPRESLAEFQKNMPADVYRQEILAEFLDDAAGVFKNIKACQTGELRLKPLKDARYIVAIDWAKKEDYTVFLVMDRDTKAVVAIYRHNEIDWNLNIDRAIRVAKEWNHAVVIMDSTGLGDVPFDAMGAVYPHVHGYTIGNNAAKVALIQKLQLAFERQEMVLPPPSASEEAGVLEHELSMYAYTMSSTGKLIFSAPEGYHDDTVIALALANWQASEDPIIYRFSQHRGV